MVYILFIFFLDMVKKVLMTMVLMRKTTAKKIKAIKITRNESYDEIINRLLKDTEGMGIGGD